MYSKSQKYEQQIERIQTLLNTDGAIIKWNDKIIDPDNPKRLRQIDVTIRHNNYLTIVECRFQKKVQDVKWIEEIMGRKESLNVDAAIAVSSSGFTNGAIKKAQKFGIIIRDTKLLTEEEIKHWGRPTKVKLVYYNYENVLIIFTIKSPNDKKLTEHSLLESIKNNNIISKIFETVAKEIDINNCPDFPVRITSEIDIKELYFEDFKVQRIILETDFKIIERSVNTPSVVVYDDPKVPSIERKNSIEQLELDDFEITKSSNSVSVVMDLSNIKNPINTQFRGAQFELGKVMHLHNIELLSRPNLNFGLENVVVEVNYVK